MKNYYDKVPEKYILDYVIDAKNKKTSIIFTLLSLLIGAISTLPFLPKLLRLEKDYDSFSPALSLIFISAIFFYIVLHELTHGLFYKIFTKEKLTFGLTLTVAYCGVPNLYVNKKTALISILAPLVIYSSILIFVIIILNNFFYCLFTTLLFAIHFGGCVGDMYGAIIMIFKYHKKTILMNDTGPKQSFYVKKENM